MSGSTSHGTMSDRERDTQLLLQAGRLLLEYNESSGAIIRTLTATATALTTASLHVAVSYGSVTVALGNDSPLFQAVKELRYNAALQTRVHEILDQVRHRQLDASAALALLGRVEAESRRHSRWLVAFILGAAAASFAGLMRADGPAALVAGVATALGLLVRQELGRRHFSLLTLPFAASFIGATLGGLAIRYGWTRTPEPVLLVPALMVVPGPHLLNSIFDLIDNHLPMCLSRLGLAIGILLASALGIIVGIELTDPLVMDPEGSNGIRLNLLADVVLAAIATCGFAAFFNTPWRRLGMVAACGMAGHGLRYLCLEAGLRLEAATFLAGLAVGAISGWLTRSTRVPVAVIAFAGAVTMIPGSSLYHALAGALQVARMANQSDPSLATRTLAYAFHGFVVVSGLALGLVLGIRTLPMLPFLPSKEKISPKPAGPLNTDA